MCVCLFVRRILYSNRAQTDERQTDKHTLRRQESNTTSTEHALANLGNEIASFVGAAWNASESGVVGSDIGRVLLVGGGAYYVVEPLRARILHLVVPPRPELANVLGYAALANELSKRERVRAAQPAETSECVPKMILTRHFSAALTPEVQRALVTYQRGHTTCRTLADADGVGKTRAAELIQQLKAKRLIDG